MDAETFLWAIGFSFALQALALNSRLLGLHWLPRTTPHSVSVLMAGAALVCWGWALHADSEAAATEVLWGAPLGLVLTLVGCTLIARQTAGGLPRVSNGHNVPFGRRVCSRVETMALEGQSDAQAVLLSPLNTTRAVSNPARVIFVLVHGGGNDRFFGFHYLIEALLSRGHRVLTAHLPGHGQGGVDRFSVAACRSRLDAMVSQAGSLDAQAQIVLIGQSLGGALSLDYWVRQRGVNAVVTVSAPHVLKLSSRLLWELSALVRPAVYRALRYGNPLESLPAVGWFKRKRFPIRVDGKRNYLDVFTEALNQLDLVQRLRAVPSAVCPLLVVHGTRDGVIPVQQAKTLGEALGNRAKLKMFSTLTHLDLLFTPAVIETIVGWVNQQFALTRSS